MYFIFASFWLNHVKFLNYSWLENFMNMEILFSYEKAKKTFYFLISQTPQVIVCWQLSNIKRIRNMLGLLFHFLFLSYMSSLISGTSLLLSGINLSEEKHSVVCVQSITSLVLKCSLNAVTHVCFLILYLAGCVSLPLWWSHDENQLHRTFYEKACGFSG